VHVCFYNQGLGDTGGVRVMLDMAKMFHQNGNKVTIIISVVTKTAFEIPEYIDIYHLSKSNLRKLDLTRYQRGNLEAKTRGKNGLRSLLSKVPMFVRVKKKLQYFFFLAVYKSILKRKLKYLNVDCFISLNMYSLLEITELFSEISHTILHIHNDPQEVYCRKNYTATVSLQRIYQNENIKIVCISVEQKKILAEFLKVEESRMCVIYNSIDFGRIETLSNSDRVSEEGYILGLGSLTIRKRFDRLILACIDANKSLKIIGDGPEKENLELLVKNNNAEKLVTFSGFINNPYPYIRNASALVLTSESEGLPTVLIEAIYLNTTVFSTACKTGPKELLLNESSQLISLEQSEKNLVSEIAARLSNLPKSNTEEITESLGRFSFENVQKKWLSII